MHNYAPIWCIVTVQRCIVISKVILEIKKYGSKSRENTVFRTIFTHIPPQSLNWGGRGRKFKSCHSDQNKWTALRCLPTYFFAFTLRQVWYIRRQHLCCHFLFLLKIFLPFYEVDKVSALDPF